MALPTQTGKTAIVAWALDRRLALAIAGLCWAGFLLVAWLVVSGRSAGFDKAGMLFWRSGPGLVPRGPAWLNTVALGLTALGEVWLRSLIVLGALVALVALRLRREAVVLALTVLGGWAFESAIKALVDRPRPTIVSHLTSAGGPGFPSGHAFNTAVVGLAIAFAFTTASERQQVRIALIGIAIVLALAIGWSRVWLGVHYPSDVIAGWFGGFGWVLVTNAPVSNRGHQSAG